jgi:queuine/archaeosine tRNA-ribosyltransferase
MDLVTLEAEDSEQKTYQDLIKGMREAIEKGVFAEFKQLFYKMNAALIDQVALD